MGERLSSRLRFANSSSKLRPSGILSQLGQYASRSSTCGLSKRAWDLDKNHVVAIGVWDSRLRKRWYSTGRPAPKTWALITDCGPTVSCPRGSPKTVDLNSKVPEGRAKRVDGVDPG